MKNKFENILSKSVKTLRVYEKGFTSVKRNPIDYQKRPNSISEFLECRVNFESFKDDVLRPYEERSDGFLFSIVCENEDESSNKYDKAILKINNSNLNESDIDVISSYIGGNKLSFTSDRHNLDIKSIE